MKRREFITLVGSVLAALPISAAAQTVPKPVVAVLVLGNPDPAPFEKAFQSGLHELGYINGQNITLVFRSAHGSYERLPVVAQELVSAKVNIIVTFQTTATIEAKRATNKIPIIMGAVGDPVGSGLVASLARPGENVTGVTGMASELGAKNLELVREVIPSASRVAVLTSVDGEPFGDLFVEHVQVAARSRVFQIKRFRLKPADDAEIAFAEMEKWQADAVIIQPSHISKRTAELGVKYRIAAFSPNSDFAKLGGLVTYSADLEALYREGATFVDKILKGRKPEDLPVQLPTKFRLTINLKTARALGINVPATLLARADDVIE